jgi:hypothetical protein
MTTVFKSGSGDRVKEIGWPPAETERAAAVTGLERGEVISLPGRGFAIEPGELFLLDAAVSDERSKNISFDPLTGRLAGTSLEGGGRAILLAMMSRFADFSQALVKALAPGYAPALQLGKTSFRPCEIEGRAMSPRKDDRRLHVDAFPSQPVQGRRILRVFANVDPEGRPRVWTVGEPFEAFAARFAGKTRTPPPGSGALLEGLGLTKGRRTGYDALMLQLHDKAKEDEAWQASSPQQRASFAPGSSWIVFTDATLHAALEGRHALEQTFFLPVQAMAEPERSPLRVLERLTGKTLT